MSYRSSGAVLGALAVSFTCWTGAGTAQAAHLYAPHENTYTTPTGAQFSVGHTDLAAAPVPPQNGMPTTREVFLNSTSYATLDAPGTGRLTAGYVVSCAVDIEVSIGNSLEAGFGNSLTLSPGASPDTLAPEIDFSLGPTFSASVYLDLTLTPGAIERVEVGGRDLVGGTTGYVMSRDFHLYVEGCAGPLTLRPYTRVTADWPEVTADGAVYGDVITL